jgi:hypothetical protein
MKEFKKSKEGLFICEECGQLFTCRENLSKHVKHHMSLDNYLDKWIKEPGDGICQECGAKIPIRQKYCSLICKRIGAAKTKSLNAKIKNEKIKETYLFICKECNEKFKTSLKLSHHIIKIHELKNYYDSHLKKEGEGICQICGHETQFYNRMDLGYRDCCSKKCADEYRWSNCKKTNMIKHKVENPYQIDEVKKNIKKSMMKKYGTKNNMQSEKGKEEYKLAINKKYGVDWPTQNKKILERGQKSAKTLKRFRNTELWYQGTYELDFLNKYYDKYPNLQRGPSIRYIYNGKNKVYHPDFYIPSLNLIIEIKSTWILNRDIEIGEKKKATISNGFKYIMIIDKDYSNL